MNENRCVMCNELIPEGRMVCQNCEDIEPNFSSVKVDILLDRIVDISTFVELALKCPDDVLVKSGNYSVSAKSKIGLLSLDLTKPLRVEFYGLIPYEVREGMKKFIVD